MTSIAESSTKLSSHFEGTAAITLAALDSLARGWSIIPLQGKKPAKNHLPHGRWKLLQKKPLSFETAYKTFRKDPTLSLGIITGRVSGIVVLDIDPRRFENDENPLAGRYLPITPTERTPSGGEHRYFRLPEGMTLPKREILPGVELIGEGGYVATAPSPGYEWFEGLSPDEIDLAELPEWVVELATAGDASRRAGTTSAVRRYESDADSSKTTRVGQVNNIVTCPHGSQTDMVPEQGECSASSRKRAGATPLRRLEGTELLRWFDQRDVCMAVVEHLGLPTAGLEMGRGKAFKCVLPGHTDCTKSGGGPSASLYVHPETGGILYRDWHAENGKEWYSLPEVAACLAYGKVIELNGPELATWALRLLVETGFISPAKVKAVDLPDDAPETVRKVYSGFLLLLACKWLHTPDVPSTFSWRFAAAWCGVDKDTAKRAMTWLLEKGYVRKVGEITASYGRKMGLFLPGTEAHVSSRADKPSRTNATKPTKATTRTKKRNISEPYSLEKRLSKARDWIEYEQIWKEEKSLQELGLDGAFL